MKKIWLAIDTWDRDLVTTAIELGIEGILCPEEYTDKIKSLGRITVVSLNGDLVPEKHVFLREIRSPEDLPEIASLLSKGLVFIVHSDWNIIAVENLVAVVRRMFCDSDSSPQRGLFLRVDEEDRIDLALTVLEKGAHGIMVKTSSSSFLKNIAARVFAREEPLILEEAVITNVKKVGMGDRVCVDLAMLLDKGEGLLVGNSGSFLFLVHGETLENPYAAPRPFRVNAGGVHVYVKASRDRMPYLSEIKAGDGVMVVSSEGVSREAVVGRVKIEKRPLLLVTAALVAKHSPEASKEISEGSIILQNAETIRLVEPGGKALSVVNLREGDRVLVYTERGGRHFGAFVDETIWEK